MDIKINPKTLCGSVEAPASKSVAHRMLICAALAKGKSTVRINASSEDIEATANCLRAIGTQIHINGSEWEITPPTELPEKATLDCGESGSTLRFMLPVAAALGIDATFTGRGRLPSRPVGILLDAMEQHGVTVISRDFPLHIAGKLQSGKYSVAGNVSSQFITGLLLALSRCAGESEIVLIPPVESRSYINITLSVLSDFGVQVIQKEDTYRINGGSLQNGKFTAEGDWSNAAFWLTAGIPVIGLNGDSVQGDKAILRELQRFGASIKKNGDCFRADVSHLSGMRIDASDIPDLVPILSVTAACAAGETVIYNASRLRLKESDRIETTVQLINGLGGNACATDDGIIIKGKERLSGGEVSGCGDHRIVMSAAIASCKCDGPVIIRGAQAVAKSYPEFFNHFNSIGGEADVL